MARVNALPGLVVRGAALVFDRNGNIFHAHQHQDEDVIVFFQSIELESPASTEHAMGATPVLTFGKKQLENAGLRR